MPDVSGQPRAARPKVALVQMKSTEDKRENLKRSVEWISAAAEERASLVCFPEFQMAYSPSGQSAAALAATAETVRGEFVSGIAEAAKKHRTCVVATFYEKSGRPGRVYDSAVEISARGQVVSVYRKLHLYDALGFKESKKLVPGRAISPPARTPAGSVGLMICYDLRFPELARILTLGGADLLVAPSAWVQGEMKQEHWRTMVKARAIENGSYVIAPDQVGNIYCGTSMAVDPFGSVLAEMDSEHEGLAAFEVDKKRIGQVRSSLPLLKNRRTDIYRLESRR